MPKNKYYVVWEGKEKGIFSSWDECKKQISGIKGAKYKGFPNLDMAKKAYQQSPEMFIGKKNLMQGFQENLIEMEDGPIGNSICVDAACSGNPGKMEYQGVDTLSGAYLFHVGPFEKSTNNIGEFLALVHALAYLKERNSNFAIYSDSKIAMNWVKNKKVNTKLVPCKENAKSFSLINRALKWLNNNQYDTKILKWETKHWGEIPADFGRK